MERIQKTQILKDLEKKMVLLVGPRQSGKTWLAKEIAKNFNKSVYLNYDQILDQKIIQQQAWLPDTELLIFDELHKLDNWKNYIKGVYDTKSDRLKILVTGSARLDLYDQLGDSLAGRYFKHRLLPFSLAELAQLGVIASVDNLIEKSGFPEPFLTNDAVEISRWRMQYINSLLGTDIFEIDKVLNVKAMQLIFNLLRHRVGSPVSYNALAKDTAVSPTTVKKYIQILEALFIIFRVTPYSKNIARSLLKESKIYFFDTGLVQGNDGIKFENLVAISLLKALYARTDLKAEELLLHYLKTKDGIETDFAIVNAHKVETILEVKLSDEAVDRSLIYFHEKYDYPALQLVKFLRRGYRRNNIHVVEAQSYLSELFL